MRRAVVAWTLLLLVSGGASRAERLYRILGPSTVPENLQMRIAGATERLAIDLDLAAVERNPTQFTLELPGGRRIVAVRESYVAYRDDLAGWFGTVRAPAAGDGGGGYVRISYHGDHATGLLILPSGERFEITFDGYGNHELVRIGGGEVALCGLGLGDTPPADPAATPGGTQVQNPLATKATARIDVLALYTDDFLASSATITQVESFIEDAILLDGNQIFANSLVGAQYQIVHMGPITGSQPPLTGIRNDLIWLNQQFDGNVSPSARTELENLRETYGADVLLLVVPQDDDSLNACGIANLPLSGEKCSCDGVPSGSPFDQRAFSVVRRGCGTPDFTAAHELGHNLGMWHDRNAPPPSGTLLSSTAYGYVIQPDVSATVMACTGFELGEPIIPGVCNRIAYFSEPRTVNGVTLGTATENNAQLARNRVGSYAGFRQGSSNGVPTVKITSGPARYALVRRNQTLFFQAQASDPEQGNLSSQIRWKVDGVLKSTIGASFSSSFSQRGDHVVTAQITDNVGQLAEWSLPFTADNPPSASFTVSCSVRTCTFTSTSTDDGGVVKWRWTLGDGATSLSPSVTHTYASNGPFTVSLRVEDIEAQSSTTQRSVTTQCTASTTQLCLQGNRFSVRVLKGGSFARTRTYSNESGFFWFGSSSNMEVGVKILDGRPVNGRWWVFHGALTSLAYTLEVTDHGTQTTKSYVRPASSGAILCGGADTAAFLNTLSAAGLETSAASRSPEGELAAVELLAGDPETISAAAGTCVPGSGYVCLLGRFKVQVQRNGSNQPGVALSNESSVFWFFSSGNIEVPVKVLDATSFNGKFWVFFGSLTNLSYQVVVTDTLTGAVKTYASPGAFCGRADTAAF